MAKKLSTYITTNGVRHSKSAVDYKIRKAKSIKISQMTKEHGYIFCEDCGRNGNNTYLDCSHTISVDECQKEGKVELAWDIENIKIRCRECHQKHDKTNLQWGDK